MAEWRWHYAVDTCGAKDDRPLETEIDIRKSSNQPLEMGFEYRSAVRTVRTDSTGLIIPASSE